MNVCWVLSEDIPSDLIDPQIIKDSGESWGSWKIAKTYSPDNCICSKTTEASPLVQYGFQNTCRLYITQDSFKAIGNPPNVKLFGGHFKNTSISNKDDIIAMNLAVPKFDIVLLAGFDFSPLLNTDDKTSRVSREEYYFNVREIIKANDTTQFVLVDYKGELASWVSELDNFTLDTVESVKNLLG